MRYGIGQSQLIPFIAPLTLWLDGFDPAGNGTQPANASALSLWFDKSGHGFHFNQAGALRPSFISSAINSKPAILFDGITQYMNRAFDALMNPAAGEVFIVCQVQGGAGTFRSPYSSRKTSGGSQLGFIFYAKADNTWGFFYGDGSASMIAMDTVIPTTVAVPRILDAQINNTAQTFYIDGASAATSSGGYLPNLTLDERIGAINETLPAFFFNGYVGEIMVYNSNLSVIQRSLITRYLANKWGITI